MDGNGPAHQLPEDLCRRVLDGLPHLTQGADGGAEAAGQVVSRHGNEVVLAALQVEHQDLLDLLLARVEIGSRRAVHENLQVDVHSGAWRRRQMNNTAKM